MDIAKLISQIESGQRKVRRSALSHAMTEELVSRNVAVLVKLPPARRLKGQAWSTEEARRFLEYARRDNDPLYAAYEIYTQVSTKATREALPRLGESLDGQP